MTTSIASTEASAYFLDTSDEDFPEVAVRIENIIIKKRPKQTKRYSSLLSLHQSVENEFNYHEEIFFKKKERERQRESKGISCIEKLAARSHYYLPTKKTIQVYLEFYCQLEKAMKTVSSSECPSKPILARLATFLGFISLTSANVLRNVYVTLEDRILKNLATNPTQAYKPAKWQRSELDVVSKNFVKLTGMLPSISIREKNELLSDCYKQHNIENRRCMTLLQVSVCFQQLSSKCAIFANRFYAASKNSLFAISSRMDKHFIYINKKEIKLHLYVLYDTLQACVVPLEYIEKLNWNKCATNVSQILNKPSFSFLYPHVFSNISFFEKCNVKESAIDLLGFLKASKMYFSPLLTRQNFLQLLEDKLLENKN